MLVPPVHVKVNTWQSVIVQLADCQQSLAGTSLGQLVSTTHPKNSKKLQSFSKKFDNS